MYIYINQLEIPKSIGGLKNILVIHIIEIKSKFPKVPEELQVNKINSSKENEWNC